MYVQRGRRSKLIFHSKAHYWDPHGPISWDMAMTATPRSWRIALRKGDKVRISATYDTRLASWYESMGIMVAWMAPPVRRAIDPFHTHRRIPINGQITHGHLLEASNYGGAATGLPDPTKLPNGQTVENHVGIANFVYLPGDLTSSGPLGQPPTFQQGQPITFDNYDDGEAIYHTITACKEPCNGSTGISYPLANGPVRFDSGELGYGPSGYTAAANTSSWALPTRSLKPGTYTFFCRIHPFMRGAFRIVK